MRYLLICVSDNLTVELLVMGVIASSFFIHGPDPRVVCLMATLYPPGYVTQRESGTVLFPLLKRFRYG